MYRLLRASVLRLYAGTGVKHLSGTRTESLRRWKRAGGPALKALQEPHTLLEPHTQEHFLFPDWGREHEDDGEVLEKGPQLRGPQRINDDDGEMLEKGPQLGALQRKHRDDDGEVRTQSKQLRGLERQLELMKGPVEEHSLIDFHDEGFPLHKPKKKRPQKVFGSPDAQAALSETSCSGCGALLHCTDPQEPGYLPSEKYKPLLEGGGLERAVCQRCFLIQHQQRALSVRMSPDQYRAVVGSIRPLSALVLLILDLLDLPHSIIPDLPQLLGRNKRVVVLGNKVDLLPGDAQNYLQRVRRQLMADCARAGISADPRDVHLISAKTGYGIETLISSLQTRGRHRGDVYLIGMANAGKSTLFNTLLESDYCKSTAADAIHRATISPWPGTTLNLLKFPILNPTAHRLSRRAERLQQTQQNISADELRRITHYSRHGYLIGHVGRTFQLKRAHSKDEVEFDADSLSFGGDLDGDVQKSPKADAELSYNEIKDAHWCYDTPGIIKENDLLSVLTEQEVKLVVPTVAITPRTFLLKPGTVLFLGGLARIDYLQGQNSCWFTVLASSRVPVHITSLDKADDIYQKHAGNTLLGVPCGGEERMKTFPPLVAQDFELQGQDCDTAIADIKISSAGWIAVTADAGDQLLLRTRAPAAAGVCLRTPPLLPHIVRLKGQRIHRSAAYKTRKPQTLMDTGLSARAAQRLHNTHSK